MPEPNGHAQPAQPERVVRVFISSTFRDMHAERDILVKRTFPQLRKLCEERAVAWTEVDLRWGVTDEQKAEGQVLPLCLGEIQRCRPYFIGLLGERYGWVPEVIPVELLESQPWLRRNLQKSVTELEILHAVFSDGKTHNYAYFYFRDPRYVECVSADSRPDVVAENPAAAEKLRSLKDQIRAARDARLCHLREGYVQPEQVGQWILEDFTALINTRFPPEQVPDALDLEVARHEAYAQSRRLAFVGRENLLQRLKEHVSGEGTPLVLTGESGCGKSALLAEWAARRREEYREELIIEHYIGSTPDGADWQGLVRRLLGEIKRTFAIAGNVPAEPEALRGALQRWLANAAAGSREIVIVLDGLDQLADTPGARQLGWLPAVFPAKIRVVVSSLPGESLDAVRRRGWAEWPVPRFERADIASATVAYFKVFSKTPPAELLATLASTPAACNALFLRAVLDELRQCGTREALARKAAEYLSAPDLAALFDRILLRWHDDFGRDPDHPDLVRRSLCLIASARFGLSETELLDVLGGTNEPLPRYPWTPLYLAAEHALALRAGLLTLGHGSLHEAVQKRWLDNEQTARECHRQLAAYFVRTVDATGRKLDELPWQLNRAGAWDTLHALVADPTFYSAFYRHRQSDALGEWSAIERESAHRIVESYGSVLRRPADHADDVLDVIANLLAVTGHWPELLRFREALAEHHALRGDQPRLAADRLGQASLLVERGDLEEGLSVLARLEPLVLRTHEPWILQELLRVRSMALWQRGALDEAMDALEARERLCRQLTGYEHELAGTLAHRSFIMQLRGQSDAAGRLIGEAQRIARESGDLVAYQAAIGEGGLLLLKHGDLHGAMAKFLEQERLCRELGDLPSLAGCLGNRAAVLSRLGSETEALALFREMATLAKKVGHEALYHVARSSQAAEIYRTSQGERAMAMNDEAIAYFRANTLAERLATSLLLKGHIHSFMLEPELANQAYEEAFALLHRLSSPREVADAMYRAGGHYLAVFLSALRPTGIFCTVDDLARQTERASHVCRYLVHAETHLRKAIQVCLECAEAHQALGDVLAYSADIDGAIAAYRRALEIRPDWIDASVGLADLLLKKESSS